MLDWMHLRFIMVKIKSIKMTKYIICLLGASFFYMCSYSQKPKILYYLPDSVEVRINDYILSQKEHKNYYCVLEHLNQDTSQVFVCGYFSKQKKGIETWVLKTNRFIVVGDKKLPLIFSYDYMYSPLNLAKVGDYGSRSKKITRQIPIIHSYRVKFTKYYILDENNIPSGFSNYQTKVD